MAVVSTTNCDGKDCAGKDCDSSEFTCAREFFQENLFNQGFDSMRRGFICMTENGFEMGVATV
jgi:hypothetical protein